MQTIEELCAERNEALENAEKLQDALWQIFIHTEAHAYYPNKKTINTVANIAINALKESGAKLKKTI